MERSALATAAAIRAGETTALAECEAAIARIELRDGPINAVVVRDFDRAREAARLIDIAPRDDSRPLLGVPMTVKESFDVAGLPTTWGFAEHHDFVPVTDAVAVQRLKAAGAVILGKTNVPPALSDLQSDNPVYGRTGNPHDQSRTCGGSSGGAAAALASGMVALEIGTDIGGSIRVPAHFCGVWGHKPTYGACSSEGHHIPRTDGHLGPLSVAGPLARDADDLAAAIDILSDLPLPRTRITSAEGLRLLVVTNHPLAKVDPAIAAAIDSVAGAFAGAGATISRSTSALPDQAKQFAGYMKLLSVTLARGEPSPDGISATLPDWFAMLDEQSRNIRGWHRLFGDYDAVLAPVLGITAFEHSDATVRDRMATIGGEQTQFGLQFAFPGMATYPGLPATAVPVATHDGLPIGLQVICDTHRDHDAIAIARLAHDLIRSPTE